MHGCVTHLPAFIFFQLNVLARLSQQLLHLEHVASASICTRLQRHLGILGDPFIHCVGNLQHKKLVSRLAGLMWWCMYEKAKQDARHAAVACFWCTLDVLAIVNQTRACHTSTVDSCDTESLRYMWLT